MAFKTHGALCTVLMLAACGSPQPRPAAPGAPAAPAAPAAACAVDAGQSEIRLLVYRAGPMARLGHNHVIVNREVSGWVDPRAGSAGGSFSLRVPVAAFMVDDRQARGEEGPDFPQDVSDDARTGTRHNMLSAAVLDADRFPIIALSSIAIEPVAAPGGAAPAGDSRMATVNIEVAGHESRVAIPFTVVRSPGRILASGTATLRQSGLGLTPLAVMLGALQVQDEFTVKFRVLCAEPTGS